MKKTGVRKLALSKETIANLEAGKMSEVVGGNAQRLSELWEVTTCLMN